MKETIIIIAILIIIIGGNFFTCKYLKNTSDDLVNDLKILKKEMNKNKEEVTDEIKKRAENIYKKWKKTENTWAIIVLHSELDLIETSIIKMKTAIEENELDRCLEEVETSIFLVEHISQKEKFCLKNVF